MKLEKYIPIKVECYSGYKADEYPTRFIREDKKYEIKEIVDRWYQGDLNPEWPASDYFKIVTVTGEEHILKHAIENDEWFLIQVL